MAKNHYVTKRKRRPKKHRTDQGTETMAKLAQLAGVPVAGSPEAAAEEWAALGDVEAGRFKTFDSVEAFMDDLKARRG